MAADHQLPVGLCLVEFENDFPSPGTGWELGINHVQAYPFPLMCAHHGEILAVWPCILKESYPSSACHSAGLWLRKRTRDTVVGEDSSDIDSDALNSDLEVNTDWGHKEIKMDAGSCWGPTWPTIANINYFVICIFGYNLVQNLSNFNYLFHYWLVSPSVALQDEAALTERAESNMTEAQALKQITFPEMDDDGLPSTYIPKVLGCLGKWQLKMHDLESHFSNCGNKSMKPLLGIAIW